MKLAASEPKSLKFDELGGRLEKLMNERGAETFLGSVMTTKGLLILLFSHRHNEEHSLLIQGSDAPKILTRVFETLAGKKGESRHGDAQPGIIDDE